MANDLFQFSSDAISGDVALVGFRGVEALSTPYAFQIFLSIAAADVPEPADVIGAKAKLRVDPGDRGEAGDVHGVVSEVEILLEAEGRALLRVELVPRLWGLGIGKHSRLFTDMAPPDVWKQVLEAGGLTSDDYELRLNDSYAEEQHICQYKESDLAFLSRWMERLGVHYYFEQGDSGEKLIVTDTANTASLRTDKVKYFPTPDPEADAPEGRFLAMSARRACISKSVKLSDYDDQNPSVDVSGEATAWPDGKAEIHHFGARILTGDDATKLATVRADELAAGQLVLRGNGPVYGPRAGYTFEVEDHPIPLFNTELFCIVVEHEANLRARTRDVHALTGLRGEAVYRARAVAVPSSVKVRPASRAPWPVVRGFELAVADGPADDDYSQIDAAGRYHVRMRFDESTLAAGKATTWIRSMQPHAGAPEGWHLPLRKATEVLVAFLGGDPDKPLLAGAAPDAKNPSPVTSKNNTRNIMHLGGNSHFEIEDQDGSQWIDMRTPTQDTYLHYGAPHDGDSHNIVAHTGGDAFFYVGTNQDIHVGTTLKETVTGDVTETYKTSQTTKVSAIQSTTVGGDVKENYDTTQETHVTSLVLELYDTGQKTKVEAGGRHETYGASRITMVTGATDENYSDVHDKTVIGPTTQVMASQDITMSSTLAQIFPSAVTQLWGATKLKMASLTWVLGSGTVVSPTFDPSTPTHLEDFLNSTTTQGNTLDVVGLSTSIFGLKADYVGFSVAATGAKFDAAGASITNIGIGMSLSAGKQDTGAVNLQGFAIVVVI